MSRVYIHRGASHCTLHSIACSPPSLWKAISSCNLCHVAAFLSNLQYINNSALRQHSAAKHSGFLTSFAAFVLGMLYHLSSTGPLQLSQLL